MTELEKIAYAKSFIDKLAQGINPLNDTPIPDNEVVNNPRLCRCFFYVSEVLAQVIINGRKSGAKSSLILKMAEQTASWKKTAAAASQANVSANAHNNRITL